MAKTGRPVGRPAKPTEVKRLLGNPSKTPLPDPPGPGEGIIVDGSIPTPPVLGQDGLDLWNSVWGAGKNWLSPTSDIQMITMMCQAYDESEDIRRGLAIGEIKRYYVLNNGQQVTHPLVNQLKDLRVQITSWLAALGFSPTDRAKLGLSEVRQNDPLDELHRRRQIRQEIS
jgi:P27 family predicted phage terminase small subunit